MIYEESDEFLKDLKRLCKKFPTLRNDIENLKIFSIELFHRGINSGSIVPIEGLCREDYISYKVRKIACRALKNRGSNSGLRLIYVYEKLADKITFLELYFKGGKENENRERIREFLARCSSIAARGLRS
jgi:mRNA-degrading endonuclease RelE of RelBE toxin-antitoxin system